MRIASSVALGVLAIAAITAWAGKSRLTPEEALAKAQAFVRKPSWQAGGILHRPFGEYHAWEVGEAGKPGAYKVTARHVLVGPTRFLVTADGVKVL